MKKSALIGICALLRLSQCGPVEAAGEKPNILFIAIDDMNDWTGFLGGHPQAITPNMDRLAKRGVNFTNAHCPAPGCSPSRNSIMYGVEPFNSGLYAFYDHADLPEEVLEPYAAMTEFFKGNGYNTYGSGKIHHRREATSKEWTEFFVTQKKAIEYDVESGYRQGKSWKMNFSPTLSPLESHVDYQNTSFGVDVLAREHDAPFFLAVGIIKPHLPFTCPKQFFDLYPKEVEPPRIKENDLSDIPAVGKALVKVGDDRRFKKDKAWNKVRRAYLACISWADFNVGRLLDALEASPYADNTIVVLWSDHGYALGEKQHFRKFALWEETTRVPLIILDTREEKKIEGRAVTDAVSLINIYSTLAELTGLEVPKFVDGVSLAPQLVDSNTPVTEPAICSWGRGNYAVRTRDWRYIRYYNGDEELYNHSEDPDEWTNLANSPSVADIKKKLAAQLPKNGVAVVMDGIEAWSMPVSADRLLGAKRRK